MLKKISLLFALLAMTFSVACNNKKTAKINSNVSAPVKIGVAPVADSEIAVVEMKNAAYGTIKIELYSNIAPQMVARFKELAKSGFYDGTTFHRVNPLVVQGGDPNSKDAIEDNDGAGESELPDVPAEFSDVPFERGIVGAARTTEVNSANCQFYITLRRFPAWDKNYTVFGKVIEGLNNADTISGAPTDKTNPRKAERPLEDVKIKRITIQAR